MAAIPSLSSPVLPKLPIPQQQQPGVGRYGPAARCSDNRLFVRRSSNPAAPSLPLTRTNPSRRLLCSSPFSSAQDNGSGKTSGETPEKVQSSTEPPAREKDELADGIEGGIGAARRSSEGGAGGGDFWGGVADEIKEIEWPVFGRVLGTTGVVLAVIAGSSVALLTVNAVLAEISDRVFAGKGVQDFFG